MEGSRSEVSSSGIRKALSESVVATRGGSDDGSDDGSDGGNQVADPEAPRLAPDGDSALDGLAPGVLDYVREHRIDDPNHFGPDDFYGGGRRI